MFVQIMNPRAKHHPTLVETCFTLTLVHFETIKKVILVYNHKAQSLDNWNVASPSGPLPSLLKLWLWGKT